jgi:hypothetical protein
VDISILMIHLTRKKGAVNATRNPAS